MVYDSGKYTVLAGSHDVMMSLQLLLRDFSYYNIEMTCVLLEHCGRYLLMMCIMKTFHITFTVSHIHDMNIYHDMKSHTLFTSKS